MGHEGYQTNISQGERMNTSFRDDFIWKEFYNDYKIHLRKTYRDVGPDGEILTEEWYDDESKKMADSRYKNAIENIKNKMTEQKVKSSYPRKLSESTKKKLLKQDEKGNKFAGEVLDLFVEEE